MLGNLRVMRTTKISEGSHNIILSHFKSDHRSVCHMLNKWHVLREDTLIDVVELLDHRASQIEKFHSGNLETSIQDGVNDLASKTLF